MILLTPFLIEHLIFRETMVSEELGIVERIKISIKLLNQKSPCK